MKDPKNNSGLGSQNPRSIVHWDLFLAAIMFYTRIPVPSPSNYSDSLLQKSRVYFPVIGWIIGLISVMVFALSSQVLPSSVAVALSMAMSVLATGAFHEDGFADSCDGLGGGWNREQVLEIMKDSRLGTYGVIGLALLLIIKYLSLLELSNYNLLLFSLIYICAHTVSRIFASLVIENYDYVQDLDKSKIKPISNTKLSVGELTLSIIFAALPICALLVLFPHLWVSISAVILLLAVTTFIMMQYVYKRIGGYTGDILGAVQQLTELLFCLTVLAFLHSSS